MDKIFKMRSIRLMWRNRAVVLDYNSHDGWNWYWELNTQTMTDKEERDFQADLDETNLNEYMQEVLNGRP